MPILSIVIPTRNEEMLEFTVRRIMATRQGADVEVIVVDDGSDVRQEVGGTTYVRLARSVGNCFARHTGIARAASRQVLILDAHMNFHEHDRWAERLAEWGREHPQDVCCTVCGQLREGEMEMSQVSGHYYGCKLKLFNRHSNGQYWILSPYWESTEAADATRRGEACEVQCVMGGAYLLDRDWYLDGLRAPWRNSRGWGASEQTISIPNWLLGGRNIILPIEIGHMFRTGQYHRVPYRTQWCHLAYNQARLATMLPIPGDLRTRLVDHVRRTPEAAANWRDAQELLNGSGAVEYRDYLATAGERDWADYVQRWGMADNWQEFQP